MMTRCLIAITVIILLIMIPAGCAPADDVPAVAPTPTGPGRTPDPDPGPLPAPRTGHPDPRLVITAPVPGSIIDGPLTVTGYAWAPAGPVRYRIGCPEGPELAGGTIPVGEREEWVAFTTTWHPPSPIPCSELVIAVSNSGGPPHSLSVFAADLELVTVPVFFGGPDPMPVPEWRVVPADVDPGLLAGRLLAELESGPSDPRLRPVLPPGADCEFAPETGLLTVRLPAGPLTDETARCLALTFDIPGVAAVVVDHGDKTELRPGAFPACSVRYATDDRNGLARRQLLADHGHDPWRLDPTAAARYLGAGLNLTDRTGLSLLREVPGEAVVRAVHRGLAADITLVQPVRTGPGGIWEISEATGWESYSPEHPDVPILMYHEIGDPVGPYRELFVGPDRFARQMQYLADNGYHTVTMADVADHWLYGKSLPDRPIVVTFDDGYRGQYVEAFPIMNRLGQVGTLYLVEDLLDRPAHLTGDMVREMLDAGFEAGGHTRSHPDLTTLPADRLADEVLLSRHRLEQRLGVSVTTFAYPAGRYDEQVLAMAEAAGYDTAVTVNPGLASHADLPVLARIRVNRSDSLERFAARLE